MNIAISKCILLIQFFAFSYKNIVKIIEIFFFNLQLFILNIRRNVRIVPQINKYCTSFKTK